MFKVVSFSSWERPEALPFSSWERPEVLYQCWELGCSLLLLGEALSVLLLLLGEA